MVVVLEWDEIYSLSAKLAYSNLLRIINDPLSKPPAILAGVKPFFAIQFSQTVVRAIDHYCLKTLLSRVRRSSLPREWYNRLLSHIKLAWADDSIAIPFAFEDWRRLLVRFQLDSALSFPDWLPLLNHMAAYDIRSPSDMASLSKADFYSVAVTSPDVASLSKLWQAACHSALGTVQPPSPLTHEWASNAPALAEALRNRDIDQTPVAQAFASAAQNLELPHSFASMGPAAKIRALQRANPSEEALSLFLNTGSQLNTLRQVQLCLRSVAAGVQ